MDAKEYKDHPEKLIGYSEFKGMGKGEGDAIKPDWVIKNQMEALENDNSADSK